jgi:3-oxoacyl-[acyl-carrier protein] reductase
MTDLAGKVALITGGSKGIGRAIALAYGKLGITVALTYMGDKDSAHDAVLEIESYDGKALAIHADVRNEASIKAMVVTARNAFGQIDILVNNAGITMAKPWQQVTTDDWNTIVATNLTSAFLTTRKSYPTW